MYDYNICVYIYIYVCIYIYIYIPPQDAVAALPAVRVAALVGAAVGEVHAALYCNCYYCYNNLSLRLLLLLLSLQYLVIE